MASMAREYSANSRSMCRASRPAGVHHACFARSTCISQAPRAWTDVARARLRAPLSAVLGSTAGVSVLYTDVDGMAWRRHRAE
jgi:hypothetical protein